MTTKRRGDVVFSCVYHVVWCSKYRRKVLVDSVAARLRELVRQECIALDADLHELKICPEYVYIRIGVDPQYGIHKAVKHIKSVSSRELRREFKTLTTRLPTLWSNSYFVSTDTAYPRNDIRMYLESQKQSQRK